MTSSAASRAGHDELGRLVVLLTALVCLLQIRRSDEHPLVMPILLTLGLVLAVLACVRALPLERAIPARPTSLLARAAGAALALAAARGALEFTDLRDDSTRLTIALLIGIAGVVGSLSAGTRLSRLGFAVVVAASATALVLTIRGFQTDIDVAGYLRHGADRVLGGHSPYGGSIANPFDADESRRYLAPAFVSPDGSRILIGFPYLPVAVVPALIAGLFDTDPRYLQAACLVAVALIARRLASDTVGEVAAVAVLASPLTVPVIARYWVEPVFVLCLAIGVLGLVTGRRLLAAIGIGLGLATKQYAAVMLPLLLLLRRRGDPGRSGWRPVLAPLVVAAVVTLPVAALDVAGFWHDAVRVQLEQPFRRDAISLVVALSAPDSTPPSWVTGALPLVAGLAVSTWIALRRGLAPAAALPAGVGLSLLATVVLSKQAFANYYLGVGLTLLLAVVTWHVDPPESHTSDGSADPGRLGR